MRKNQELQAAKFAMIRRWEHSRLSQKQFCENEPLLSSACPKTSCLDGKIQFRGMLKKMIVKFTGINDRLFFLAERQKWSFRPNAF